MIRSSLPLFVLTILCTGSTGCRSLITNAIGFETAAHPNLYAGVKSDVQQMKEDLSAPPSAEKFGSGVLTAVDLPFSAAMDTLLLPFWIPDGLHAIGKTMREGNEALAQNIRQSKPYIETQTKLDELEHIHLERTVGWAQREPPVSEIPEPQSQIEPSVGNAKPD